MTSYHRCSKCNSDRMIDGAFMAIKDVKITDKISRIFQSFQARKTVMIIR